MCVRCYIFLKPLPVFHTHAPSEACPVEACILDPAKEEMCTLNRQITFFFHFRAVIKHTHICCSTQQSIKFKNLLCIIIIKKL